MNRIAAEPRNVNSGKGTKVDFKVRSTGTAEKFRCYAP